MNSNLVIAAAAALALLAGCGGAEVETVEAPQAEAQVPASATASPQAYVDYAGSLPADDRAEPIDIGAVDAPTSETAEPIDVG